MSAKALALRTPVSECNRDFSPTDLYGEGVALDEGQPMSSNRRPFVMVMFAVSALIFLFSLRLFLNLLFLHLGYGVEVLLPRWVIDHTSPSFQILYSLLGGPILLGLAIIVAWRSRRFLFKGRVARTVQSSAQGQ